MTKSRARVLLPNRGQMEFRACGLDSPLAPGHRARLVWAYVERQELTRFYAGIRALEGGVGRAAIAPEIVLSAPPRNWCESDDLKVEGELGWRGAICEQWSEAQAAGPAKQAAGGS